MIFGKNFFGGEKPKPKSEIDREAEAYVEKLKQEKRGEGVEIIGEPEGRREDFGEEAGGEDRTPRSYSRGTREEKK